ncbi:MAG TPA: flavin prenyltransferase UbiX [Planctomycetota bacterium]|nr:flavin prenyltransferase UbiX [Planctomycetota bacterium]
MKRKPRIKRPAKPAQNTRPLQGATPKVFPRRRLFLAITGASGAPYALRALELLAPRTDLELHVCVSRGACEVLRHETGLALPASPTPADLRRALRLPDSVTLHALDAIAAGPSSGSFAIEAMLVLPCSMGTMAAIAHGLADNLIVRAASVMLKERRKLILVPRETPLSLIQIENMLKVTQAGAIVLPAMPGFYGRPTSVADLVDFVVARALETAGFSPGRIGVHWKGPSRNATS